jgi:hypothetical protein
MTPLPKLGPPGPPGFSSYRCRSRASNRAVFALVFDPSLCVTAPRKKVGAFYLLVGEGGGQVQSFITAWTSSAYKCLR